MNEAGHRQRALDIEQTIADLGDPAARPHICAVLIESYWGASFHWIIVGCMGKHTWHTDSHPGLVRHLTTLGEPAIATEWTTLERLRTNGWYTYQATLAEVAQAKTSWQVIRDWATS